MQSKVASLVLAGMFLVLLWWARTSWLSIVVVLLAVAVILAGWFIKDSEPLRFIVVCPASLIVLQIAQSSLPVIYWCYELPL